MKGNDLISDDLKHKCINNYPQMVWLNNNYLFDSPIFPDNFNEFVFVINELSNLLTKDINCI